MFDYDTPAARATYRSFKSRLTRLVNKKDHAGVIALHAEFMKFYDDRNWPLPDDWHRWLAAAGDAALAMERAASW